MRMSDWSSDVCSSDRAPEAVLAGFAARFPPASSVRHHQPASASSCSSRSEGYERSWPACEQATEAPHCLPGCTAQCGRSEEHTSELQSLMRISYAVFCLKKKQQNINKTQNDQILFLNTIKMNISLYNKYT